jgi:hypothetical protein
LSHVAKLDVKGIFLSVSIVLKKPAKGSLDVGGAGTIMVK